VDADDPTCGCERLTQAVLGRVEAQVADENFSGNGLILRIAPMAPVALFRLARLSPALIAGQGGFNNGLVVGDTALESGFDRG